MAGAADVGMQTAYLVRPTVPWADVYPEPTVSADGYEPTTLQLDLPPDEKTILERINEWAPDSEGKK